MGLWKNMSVEWRWKRRISIYNFFHQTVDFDNFFDCSLPDNEGMCPVNVVLLSSGWANSGTIDFILYNYFQSYSTCFYMFYF